MRGALKTCESKITTRIDTEHVHVGKTPTRGAVVKLDRSFMQADLKIATELVEPHFMGESLQKNTTKPKLYRVA